MTIICRRVFAFLYLSFSSAVWANVINQGGNGRSTTPRPVTPEEYLASLAPAAPGSSFNGSTTQQIAAAIPEKHALALEIANYLDTNLTNYRLNLDLGSTHQKAPTTILSQTKEIFTFKKRGIFYPWGTLLYQIENTDLSLHMFFYSAGKYAAGFLDNNAHLETLWPIWRGCSKYNNTRPPASFQCFQEKKRGTTKTFLIHQDSIYAKLTAKIEDKTSIVKIETFNFDL